MSPRLELTMFAPPPEVSPNLALQRTQSGAALYSEFTAPLGGPVR
jgi:hypothetical protein